MKIWIPYLIEIFIVIGPDGLNKAALAKAVPGVIYPCGMRQIKAKKHKQASEINA